MKLRKYIAKFQANFYGLYGYYQKQMNLLYVRNEIQISRNLKFKYFLIPKI